MYFYSPNTRSINNMASEDNRKRIVETAMQLFNSRGLRGVTMDDIANTLHISKRTLYETFSNKEELLAECLMLVHDEIEEEHKRIYQKVDEPLLVALYMIRVNAMSNHCYHHLIEESERYYPEIHDRYFKIHTASFRDKLTQAILYAESKNYLRPNVDIATTVDFICEFLQRHRLSEVDNRETYSHMVSEIGFTFLRGLMSTETLRRYEEREDEFQNIINHMNENI